jgi:small ligand-binding sensory domain FIST
MLVRLRLLKDCERAPKRAQNKQAAQGGPHSVPLNIEGQAAFRDGELLVRNIVGADQDSGALAIGAYPREHQVLQFVLRDAEAARADLDEQLGRYARGVSAEPAGRPGPVGALLFSCLGRGQQLFGEPDHDSRRLFEHLGRMPLGGFFCNGEIGQVGGETFAMAEFE